MSKDKEVQEIEPQDLEKNVTMTLKDGDHGEEVIRRTLKVQFDIGMPVYKGKVMDPKSETHPDMHLTVRQLLENHTRGADGQVHVRQPLYFDTEVPTFQDITQVEEYKQHLMDKLARTESLIKEQKFAAEKGESNKKPKEAPKSGAKADPKGQGQKAADDA